jgi:hypothetical protein
MEGVAGQAMIGYGNEAIIEDYYREKTHEDYDVSKKIKNKAEETLSTKQIAWGNLIVSSIT